MTQVYGSDGGPPCDNPEAPRRALWRRWLADPVLGQLTQGITPRKISLTIAVGGALALFPILGTTTVLCAVAAIALGLNQGIIQGVNALCTPIYFPLIVAFVRLGETLSGSAHSRVNIPAMIDQFSHHPGQFLRQFGLTALHAVLGWACTAPFLVALIYLVALPPLRVAAARIRQRGR